MEKPTWLCSGNIHSSPLVSHIFLTISIPNLRTSCFSKNNRIGEPTLQRFLAAWTNSCKFSGVCLSVPIYVERTSKDARVLAIVWSELTLKTLLGSVLISDEKPLNAFRNIFVASRIWLFSNVSLHFNNVDVSIS